MTNHTISPESEKDNILTTLLDESLKGLDGPDAFLPFPTETSPLPAESRIVVHTEPRSAGADRFRLVQVRLRHMQATRKIKSLLISSPLPGEGKSTAAINLATALSEQGKRSVLLLEGDVYRPSLIKKLGLNSWPGLTECLDCRGDPMLAIRRVDPLGFYLLPAGSPTEAGNFLQSALPPNFIDGLAGAFRWILIDAPPTTPVAEILALKALSDATLLVARAGETSREAIEEATRQLGVEHVIGLVLNGVEGLDRVYSKYYGYTQRTGLANLFPQGMDTWKKFGRQSSAFLTNILATMAAARALRSRCQRAASLASSSAAGWMTKLRGSLTHLRKKAC